jgi:hypothetical protein
MKDHIEAGRQMSERETRLTCKLLDAHGRRLDDLTSRVDEIERVTKHLGSEVAYWRAHEGAGGEKLAARTS